MLMFAAKSHDHRHREGQSKSSLALAGVGKYILDPFLCHTDAPTVVLDIHDIRGGKFFLVLEGLRKDEVVLRVRE